MNEFAENEEFEAAAQVRDSMAAVHKSLSRQDVVQDTFVDQDVFGLWRDADLVFVAVLFIRGGKWVGSRTFKQTEQEFPDGEVIRQFVQQYYLTGTFVPDTVLVPCAMDDAIGFEPWLSELKENASPSKLQSVAPNLDW